MKKSYLLLAFALGTTQLFSQTLFTYGGIAVSKSEFLRAYNKNKTPVVNNEKSLREYLDLYSKFKLKVLAAQVLKLDTLQQLRYDLKNFSSQVEEGYMTDEKRTNALLDEAIERSQKDIHLIHFFVALTAKTTKADSINTIRAINEAEEILKAGTTDYADLANKLSKKYVPVVESDMGFITALSIPYAIENLVYNIKPTNITAVYRARSGLHIFKNIGERESAGRWKIAQILFAIPPGATPDKIKEIEKRAIEVYALLQAGADFRTLAKQYSEDKLTAINGGELPEFGTGKFDPSFEAKAFELQKDSNFTKPFYTIYGYHIVKRLQQQPTPKGRTDEAFVSSLKLKIEKDSRIELAKEDFIKEIILKIGYKRNTTVKDAELFNFADSVTAKNVVGNYPINNKIILSFTKSALKGIDWLNFVKDYKLNADVYKGETNKELLNKYISTSVLDYYRKHLAEYNTDFKYQLQEFKEGNMLFEIMEKNVWGKASADSIGLKTFYDQHSAKYLWDSSAAILLFNCNDLKTATEAITALNNGSDWKQIMEKSNGKIQTDSGRYELAQLQLPENAIIKPGLITPPIINSGDNTTSFIKVLQIFPVKEKRTFSEAKGLIINDYQNFLEEKWIEILKEKYPVKINEAVFKSLL